MPTLCLASANVWCERQPASHSPRKDARNKHHMTCCHPPALTPLHCHAVQRKHTRQACASAGRHPDHPSASQPCKTSKHGGKVSSTVQGVGAPAVTACVPLSTACNNLASVMHWQNGFLFLAHVCNNNHAVSRQHNTQHCPVGRQQAAAAAAPIQSVLQHKADTAPIHPSTRVETQYHCAAVCCCWGSAPPGGCICPTNRLSTAAAATLAVEAELTWMAPGPTVTPGTWGTPVAMPASLCPMPCKAAAARRPQQQQYRYGSGGQQKNGSAVVCWIMSYRHTSDCTAQAGVLLCRQPPQPAVRQACVYDCCWKPAAATGNLLDCHARCTGVTHMCYCPQS